MNIVGLGELAEYFTEKNLKHFHKEKLDFHEKEYDKRNLKIFTDHDKKAKDPELTKE